MPSTATITAFYTFSAGQKARANEVNNNFSVFRGHLIPVNTDTATSSDLTHSLGDADHQWASLFVGTVKLTSSTTTAALIIEGNTSDTTGSINFIVGGVTVGAFKPGGIQDSVTSNLDSRVTSLSTTVQSHALELTSMTTSINLTTATSAGTTQTAWTVPTGFFFNGYIYLENTGGALGANFTGGYTHKSKYIKILDSSASTATLSSSLGHKGSVGINTICSSISIHLSPGDFIWHKNSSGETMHIQGYIQKTATNPT